MSKFGEIIVYYLAYFAFNVEKHLPASASVQDDFYIFYLSQKSQNCKKLINY
jgi:hypothetical protein